MSGGGGNSGSLVVLFIFISLLVSIFLKSVLNKIHFPYTPIIFIYGLVTGIFVDQFGTVGDATSLIQQINPHLLLLIFMPSLIFESAFNMSWHTFRKESLKAFLLAVPGCLLNMVLVAVVLKYILRYDVTFAESVLFGAIINLTDPQAVIHTLHESGVPKTVLTLIEGEALLKDGICFIIFQILTKLTEEDAHLSDSEIVKIIFSLIFGGPVLGILFGLVAAYWLGKMMNKPVIELGILFITPYLLFYVCENTGIEFSGTAGILTLGLYMSNYGRTKISQDTTPIAHGFCEFQTFCADSLVFIISGVLVGERIMSIHSEISTYDWIALIPLFILLILLRALIVLMLYPLLKRIGYGFSMKNSFVLVYSGLRGAVALVLAMTLYTNHNIREDVRYKILFFTECLTSLTILINGTTMKPFVKWLKIVEENPAQEKIYEHVILHLIDNTFAVVNNDLKKDSYLSLVDWNQVKVLVTNKEFLEIYHKNAEIIRDQSEQSSGDSNTPLLISDQQVSGIMHEARHRYLSILKGVYWEQYSKGQCLPIVLVKLIEATDSAMDCANEEMRDWEILEGLIASKARWGLVTMFRKIAPDFLFKKWLMHVVTRNYESTVSFIRDHECALERLKEFRFPEDIYNKIKSEVFFNIESANQYMTDHMSENYQDVIVYVQTHKAAYQVLHHQLNFTKHFYEKGILTEHEYEHSKEIIEKTLVDSQPKCQDFINIISSLDQKSLIPKLAYFRDNYNEEEIENFLTKSGKIKSEAFSKNDIIIKEGEEYKYIYIVAKGSVKMSNEHSTKIVSMGGMFGIPYILNKKKSLETVTANLMTIVLRVPMDLLLPFYEKDINNREKFWRDYIEHFIRFSPKDFGIIKDANIESFLPILKRAEYKEYAANELVSIGKCSILLKGIIGAELPESATQENSKGKKLVGYHHYPVNFIPNQSEWRAIEDSSFFVFNECVKTALEKTREDLLTINNLVEDIVPIRKLSNQIYQLGQKLGGGRKVSTSGDQKNKRVMVAINEAAGDSMFEEEEESKEDN